MLMMRIDDPIRKEVPFAGFHLAQSWKAWHSLRIKAGCEKLCGIELVDHVFHCGLGLRRVVNHTALTAFETVLTRCSRAIDRHLGLRSEDAGDCEQLGFSGSLKGENI